MTWLWMCVAIEAVQGANNAGGSHSDLLRTQVFWDAMLCLWVSGSWCLKGSYCLNQKGLSSPRRNYPFHQLTPEGAQSTTVQNVRNRSHQQNSIISQLTHILTQRNFSTALYVYIYK